MKNKNKINKLILHHYYHPTFIVLNLFITTNFSIILVDVPNVLFGLVWYAGKTVTNKILLTN